MRQKKLWIIDDEVEVLSFITSLALVCVNNDYCVVAASSCKDIQPQENDLIILDQHGVHPMLSPTILN